MPRLTPEGRKATDNVLVMPISRPNPPPNLDKEQAKFWRATVERMPPNWFLPEALPVLEAYSVQVSRQRLLASQLNELIVAKDFGDQYFRLLNEEHKGARALMSLATRLRLTPQSTYSKNKQKPVVPMKNPWEDDNE
jgi:hypothetical protein